MKSISIIMPILINSRQMLQMTINCLDDIIRSYGMKVEIILVDDYSDPSIRSENIIKNMFPVVKWLSNDQNMGFAKTCNKGIRSATYDYVCLLNNDIRLPNRAWLKLISKTMDKFDITAPAFGRLSLPHYEYLPGETKENSKVNKKEFNYPVGWCLCAKREIFDKIKLSEAYGFGFFEDVDFAYRSKKKEYTMCITEGTKIQHLYHTTFKNEGYDLNKQYNENRKIFLDIIKREK